MTSNIFTPRRGYRWQEGIPGFSMFNHLQTPNDSQYPVNFCRMSCSQGCNMDSGYSAPASSNHPGGVNALFADGSVKFIKSSVQRMTWWREAPGATAKSSPLIPIDSGRRSLSERPSDRQRLPSCIEGRHFFCPGNSGVAFLTQTPTREQGRRGTQTPLS